MLPDLVPPPVTTPFSEELRARLFKLTHHEIEDLRRVLWQHQQTLRFAMHPHHDEYLRHAVALVTRADPEPHREHVGEAVHVALNRLSGPQHATKSRDFGRGVAHAVREVRNALKGLTGESGS